jgi:hypothetical protein
MLGWFFLVVGSAFCFKAATALKSGRIVLGWTFENLVAERSQNPLTYWYMLSGSALMGILGVGVGMYQLLFAGS